MTTVSFSLTEKVIIDPILTFRAPLCPETERFATWTTTVWQAIESEVVSRIVALATSFFAAADALIHLATGLYQGTCLLLRNIGCLNSSKFTNATLCAHFRQAAWFAGLTVIGSIVGAIWPDIFKHCRYSPPPPTDLPPNSNQNPDTPPNITTLKEEWRESSLEEKRALVEHINRSGSPDTRRALADTVYQSPLQSRQVQWLSPKEVETRVASVWQTTSYSFFYHATSERALESILKSKKVEVRHEKAFRGAFVSTRPETGFGRCILAFKKNIERLSSIEHGFRAETNAYWAGFSRDIPVTDSTLAYIILDEGTLEDCQKLENRCKQWTGRSIHVTSLQSAQHHLTSVQNLHMGIPAEWPLETDGTAPLVLNTLRARAEIAIPTTAQIKTSVSAHLTTTSTLYTATIHQSHCTHQSHRILATC